MTDVDHLARLRERLRAEPPASLSTLDPVVLGDLTDIVIEARRAQARALTDSFDNTLKHVPFPIRGVLKRILT